ncbi:MAG: hypothetical protein DYG90_13930 [Chloroflexi bacterium CFX6]|nr:hypothetical protein [Chloroflexi bacterium CFX6]
MTTEQLARALAAIEAIERRADAATAGPWRECQARDGRCGCGNVWSVAIDMPVLTTDTDSDADGFSSTPERKTADAAFIAAARTDVPALVALARAVVALERERLVDDLSILSEYEMAHDAYRAALAALATEAGAV